MGEGGQIWLKCITGDLIMMIRDKNNIFERVENFHADLARNYPGVGVGVGVGVGGGSEGRGVEVVGGGKGPASTDNSNSPAML